MSGTYEIKKVCVKVSLTLAGQRIYRVFPKLEEKMKLSEWLRQSGISVTKVAENLGVSRQTIYGWVNGDYLPRVKHLQRLYELSGGDVSLQDFDLEEVKGVQSYSMERQDGHRVERDDGRDGGVPRDDECLRRAGAGMDY